MAERALAGAAYAVTASLIFVLMDTVIKWLGQTMPIPQVLWGRYTFHFLFIVLLIPILGPAATVQTRQPGRQIVRGLCLALASLLGFTALKTLPLTDLYAMSFTAPLIVTVLAIPLLGEKVGIRRWSAVLVGLFGVLIIIRPGLITFNIGMGFALAMAFVFALYQLLTRSSTVEDGPVVGLFYAGLVGTLTGAIALPFFWTTPQPIQWALLMLAGLLGATAHLFLILALRNAAASFVSPFMYAQIIWATIIGALIFSDLPDPFTLLGAAILVGAGIFVLWRERVTAGQ